MPFSNIDKGSKYFDTKLYTGNGSTQTITGLEFSPDFVWTKNRTNANSHQLYDSVRGVQKALFSNGTDAEETNANYLTAFNSDGFSVGSSAGLNGSGTNVVSWNWDANGSGSSNTSGSITSTVSANTTSGFSIVSYTGTGSNATVGHGLGVAPRMIILKSRTDSGADWRVYHASVGNTGYLELNTTGATTTSSTTWQNTTPTSTVFSIGTSGTVNLNTGNFIAYCFADVKGFSKFGSYIGNGSADGTFIYTGFKPAFVIVKCSSNADEDWIIFDNKRNDFNGLTKRLMANLSNAEGTDSAEFDFVSNGFKCRYASSNRSNASGRTYIYMCFAENPFVSSKGVPVCAR